MRDHRIGRARGEVDVRFSGCAAGPFGEGFRAGTDVQAERSRPVEARRFVAGVVLGDDGGEGLGLGRDLPVGCVVEEHVAPGDFGRPVAGAGAQRQHAVEGVEESDDLVDGHGLQRDIEVLVETWIAMT